MWTAKYVCAVCSLSIYIRLGCSPGALAHTHACCLGQARCWGPQAAPRRDYWFSTAELGQHQSQRPTPMPVSVVLQLVRPGSQQVGFPKPSPGGPSCKRKPGKRPQARLTMTRCETSSYNTGPGRCSDPSCLVLQPEGRRSAAEPNPPPGDSAQKDRVETQGRPAGARWVQCPKSGSGQPTDQPLFGARSVSVQGFASALIRFG